MIKNHTHNNDSGSIHYIFKKILDLGIIQLVSYWGLKNPVLSSASHFNIFFFSS